VRINLTNYHGFPGRERVGFPGVQQDAVLVEDIDQVEAVSATDMAGFTGLEDPKAANAKIPAHHQIEVLDWT
jgi:hypothetical protein